LAEIFCLPKKKYLRHLLRYGSQGKREVRESVMKKIIVGIIPLVLLIFFSVPVFSQNTLQQLDILVRFKNQESATTQNQRADALGYREVHKIRPFNISRWRIHETSLYSLEETLKILRSDPTVDWAEPNFPLYKNRVPNDPLFPRQWHLLNTGQTGGTPGADIQADSAWDLATGRKNVVVAVLDTGINYEHPDLRANMWINPGEDRLQNGQPGFNGKDDDNNGYIDDYYGISVVDESQQPPIRRPGDTIDTDGHGTHVSGIIGAVGNNALGVSGINWNIQMMSLKFIGPQGGDVAGLIECVAYILDQKQKGIPIYIANASYGGSSYSQFEKEAYEALRDQGILLVTSAGNAGADLDTELSNYPGAYNIENIINVAATTKYDQLAGFSNYGQHAVHLGAPGSEILSTYLGQNYELLGGTSMAAPQVSGALGLIHSRFDASMSEAKERIFRGVDTLADLQGKVFTNGRLNINKALTAKLTGPFIFSLSPINGSPGSMVTLTGVRFGAQQNNSSVMFSEVKAEIINWGDNEIKCRVPDLGMNIQVKVVTNQGTSNSVSFTAGTSHRYYLPFAPAMKPWVSYLILTNLGNEPLDVKVRASEAGAFVLDTFQELLGEKQVLYRNIRNYGLLGLKNILWVESTQNIQVGILVFYSDGDLTNFTYIRAQRP